MSAPEIDPTQATSESLKRGVFVGISAAATLAAITSWFSTRLPGWARVYLTGLMPL